MKKNTRLAAAFLAFLALIGLFAGLYLSSRPAAATGVKSVVVEVVYADKSTKSFRFETEQEYLGDLLLSEGLVVGTPGAYGLYITQVDGEAADFAVNGAYWALFLNGEYATQGADTTPITDGDQVCLVYTLG